MNFFKTKTWAAFGLLLAATSTKAHADPVGVFALLERAPDNIEQSAAAHECQIRRHGPVLARQGNMDLPEAGSFVLMSCEEGLLQSPGKVGNVFGDMSPIVTLEGALTDYDVPAGASAPQDREYLIKLAYYNNSDLEGRSSDLNALQEMVKPLADPYYNETFLEVHRAAGMRTPDEAVMIYYDSPEAGNRFRENNQAVLERVGAFNMKHLVSFIYLVARAN